MIDKLYSLVHRLFSKPENRGEYSGGYWQEKVRKSVLNLIPQEGALLEVGCGEGLFLADVAKTYTQKSISGIDVWDVILNKAKERMAKENISNVELKLSDGAALPYPDHKFAQTVCMNVLFNLPSDEKCKQVLIEMKRVTRKQCKIVCDIRSKSNIFLALKYKLAPFYDKSVKDLPLRLYSKKKILDFFKEQKCEIVSVKCVGWFLFMPALYVIEVKTP